MTTEVLEDNSLDSAKFGLGEVWIRGRSKVGDQKYGEGLSSNPFEVVLEISKLERYSPVAGVIRYNYVSLFGEDIRSQFATERTASTLCWPFSFSDSVGDIQRRKVGDGC